MFDYTYELWVLLVSSFLYCLPSSWGLPIIKEIASHYHNTLAVQATQWLNLQYIYLLPRQINISNCVDF